MGSPMLCSVARTANVPDQLRLRPFSLAEARSAGLTLSALKGKSWRRVGPRLYRWSGLREDPWTILAAWQRSLPKEAMFACSTAAWLLRLSLKPLDPVEVAWPKRFGMGPRSGARIYRFDVAPEEATTVRGLRATALQRTLIDLCTHRSELEALIAMDAARRLNLRWTANVRARPGAARLRRLSELSAPAESPMETRLRWLLISAGLPNPQVQVKLHDDDGEFIGRADMFYPGPRVAIEFDGGNHRERLVTDDRRQNRLVQSRYRVLRYTSSDLQSRPELVVAQVRGSLSG